MNDPYKCRSCGAGIALADVNVANDIALCRACGKTMPFSEIAPIPGASNVDLRNPPKGVRIEENPMQGRTIIYKKISPIVLFLIPFTAFWSGLSMFGIYGSQIKKGHFDLGQSLFGLPFLIGTVFLVSFILFCLFGRWRITFAGRVLQVSMQLGPLVWTRKQGYSPTTRVSLQNSQVQRNGNTQRMIQVETQGEKLKFGTMFPEEVKEFIAETVRRTIAGS